MNNYTIDASIYLIPDVNNLSLEDKTKEYREFISRITILKKILQSFKKDVKLYFFQKDIKLLINNNKLFTKEKLTELRKLNLGKKYDSQLNDLYDFYLILIDKLKKRGYDNVSNKIYSKYITIETHLNVNINDLNIGSNPIYEPCIGNISYDTAYLNLLNKKMILHAFLNHYVYLNNGINKLLIYPDVPDKEIKITARINEITHQFSMNEIPRNHFLINKQIVEFYKFNNINNRNIFDSIDQALQKAKENFSETLFFSSEVNESIKKYKETMFELLRLMPSNSIILNHIDECPYTLYDHLDSLDKLVKYYKSTKQIPINKRKPISNKYVKKYNDRDTCYSDKEIVCKKCSAFLRFCRYDCSGETSTEERIIDGKLFQIHLKPYEYGKNGCNKDIADLTLRIYFRWDDDKIQVGYIGKHLPSKTP